MSSREHQKRLVRALELIVEGLGSASSLESEIRPPYLQFVIFAGSLLSLAWRGQVVGLSKPALHILLRQSLRRDSTFRRSCNQLFSLLTSSALLLESRLLLWSLLFRSYFHSWRGPERCVSYRRQKVTDPKSQSSSLKSTAKLTAKTQKEPLR